MTFEAPKKSSVVLLYGLINAGVAILFLVILYLAGAKSFVSPVTYVGIALPIVICVLGGLQQRKALGGHMTFGQALKATFGILAIRAFIITIFEYILLNYIDVPFRQAVAQATAEKTEEMMVKFKMPEDQIDKAVEQILNGNNYTIGNLFMSFAVACIGWFIISLIVSAIIKRNPPPFANTFNQ